MQSKSETLFCMCFDVVLKQIIFKKSKQPFTSRYCGSRNLCKKHDIIKPNFYTILHNLASSITILKHTSSIYVRMFLDILPFGTKYEIELEVSGILFFEINVPLLVDTLRLQKYAKLYCLSNFIYL